MTGREGLVLDPRTRVFAGGRTLLGGDPWRVLRLSEAGARAVRGLLAGDGAAGGGGAGADALARRLVAAGLAHPRPAPAPTSAVTVLIPVRDRAAGLERCLAAVLATDRPGRVLVVDDGSRDPAAVDAACRRHGAELIRRERPGGPAAARNDGLARIDCGPVALLDCDCVPEPGWLSLLCGALAADPRLGAVAPRVRPAGCPSPGSGVLRRFAATRSPLDLGPWPSLVRPAGRVGYVPTAALLLRDRALGEGRMFDPALRYGEDVDLVWRMVDAGRPVRYEPAAVVRHEEPASLGAWLARRFRYGGSAGPLAIRHPGRLAPVTLHPRSLGVLAVATGALAARRPLPAAAALAVHAGLAVRSLSPRGVPPAAASALALRALAQSAAALGRAATMLGPEPLAAALLLSRPGSPARRLATRRPARAVGAGLLLASPVHELTRRRPALDPVRFTALALADDVAYGAGVWAGALRARTAAPLRPRVLESAPPRRPRTAHFLRSSGR